jgi:hypothetical protein
LIRVIDVETKKPIENVDVFVQEIGSVGITAKFGLAKFSNVPMGKIIVELNKDGYIYKKQEINITNNESENIITLELTQAKLNYINIWGVVKQSSKTIPDIEVSVRSAKFMRKIVTDKYGYYNISIPKDSVTSLIYLSVKDVRYNEEEIKIQVLQNEIEKEVSINLKSSTSASDEMQNSECIDNEYYYGKVRFVNEFKEDLVMYMYQGYEDQATYRGYREPGYKPESGLIVPAGGESESTILKIHSIHNCPNCPKSNGETFEYKFYFMTVNEKNRKYGVIFITVEKCKIKSTILSPKKVFLSSKIPD